MITQDEERTVVQIVLKFDTANDKRVYHLLLVILFTWMNARSVIHVSNTFLPLVQDAFVSSAIKFFSWRDDDDDDYHQSQSIIYHMLQRASFLHTLSDVVSWSNANENLKHQREQPNKPFKKIFETTAAVFTLPQTYKRTHLHRRTHNFRSTFEKRNPSIPSSWPFVKSSARL